MPNSGIITQYGFEFQKLAFVYYALKLAPESIIVYEGQDDIETTKCEQSLQSFHQAENFIQVKSGIVTKPVLKKIFMNWLASVGQPNNFVCIIENELKINYKEQTFIEELINEIFSSNEKSKTSIARQLNNIYRSKSKEILNMNLTSLIQKAQFITYSLEQLTDICNSLFASEYGGDTKFAPINKERFKGVYNSIIIRISAAMLKKEPLILSFQEIQQIISDIRAKISENCYEKSYDQFKKSTSKKIEKLLSMENESIKQLKLVFPYDVGSIINGLTEKIFYEDLRSYYSEINKDADIRDMEFNAHSNYEDILQEFKAVGELPTPFDLYNKTTKQQISSPLLPAYNSSGFKFYNRGCYIHLTDTGIEEDLKIKWGEPDDEL